MIACVIDPTVARDTMSKQWLAKSLLEAGFQQSSLEFYLSCEESQDNKPKAKEIIAYADEVLLPAILEDKPELIIAFGNNAICALGLTTKTSGITKFRGKRALSEKLGDIPIVATCSVHAVMFTPQTQEPYFQDLAIARRALTEEIFAQEPFVMIELDTPQDVLDMIAETLKTEKKTIAYDVETTGLRRNDDIIVTMGFCNGVRNDDGVRKAYIWAGYDKLVPRYTEEEFAEFVKVFRKLFKLGGKKLSLIGHNISFDDWIIESYIGCEFEGSDWDTMILKWLVNSDRPHGLKECTARYLGFPDYDGVLSKHTDKIKHRRGRVLNRATPEGKEDFKLLRKWFPNVEILSGSKEGTFLWPESVDKGFAMFALVDLDILTEYNCLGGDTLVQTFEQGVVPIKDLAGTTVKIRDGKGDWVPSKFDSYGHQETIELSFGNTITGAGLRTIRATKKHMWHLLDGRKVTTEELVPGMIIPNVSKRVIVDETTEDYRKGIQHGLIYGDGTRLRNRSDYNRIMGYQIRLCGADSENLSYFEGEEGVNVCYPPSAKGDPIVTLRGVTQRDRKLKELPLENVSTDYLTGFFRGWFSADGCICSRGKTITLCVGIDESKWLRDHMPKIGIEFGSGSLVVPGYGSYPGAKKVHVNLRVQNYSLTAQDFLLKKKRDRFSPVEAHFVYRGQVPNSSQIEEVFCAVVPTTNSFALEGGLLTGNCLDSIYTFMLWEKFLPEVMEDGLQDSCDLRHDSNRILWKTEQQGILLDVKTNRSFAKDLGEIIKSTELKIIKTIKELNIIPEHEAVAFNPDSPNQVAHALYGEIGFVPVINRRYLAYKHGETLVNRVCDEIENEVYGDYEGAKTMLREDFFQAWRAEKLMTKLFEEKTNLYDQLRFVQKPLGLGNLCYNPVALTKTNLPSCSKSSLLSLQQQKPNDLVSLILMFRRATKIKKNFIDKVYASLRPNGTTSSSYKVTGTSCVSGDTWVSTLGGLRKMKDLYETDYDVNVWNGTLDSTKEDCFVPAQKVKYENRDGKEITLEYGFSLKASNNHPVKTQRGFVRVDELTLQDSVEVWNGGRNSFGKAVLPSYSFVDKSASRKSVDCTIPSHITVELAEFMGMYLADGDITYIPESGHYTLRLSNSNKEIQDRFVELIFNVFGLTANQKNDTVWVSCKKLVDWMIFLGLPYGEGRGMAKDKVIPDCFMSGSFKLITALLKGLTLDAHSTYTKSGVAYGTQSIIMQDQIQQLLLILGILSYKANPKDNPMKLCISKGYLPRFMALIGCIKNELRETLYSYITNSETWKEPAKPNEILLIPIKKITNWKGDVYDLSMPETALPQYVANGMIVHNTARISSAGWFNWQNFIKELRGQFIPKKGYKFITLDYSAAEVRVMAACSQDKALLEAIKNSDLHTAIAAKVFKKAPEDVTSDERKRSKTATFLILYGGGADKLALAFNITRAEAQDIIDQMFEAFPDLKPWMDEVIESAYQEPHCVRTALGTKRTVKNVLSSNVREQLKAERQAVNSIIQGTAGELTLYKIREILDEASNSGVELRLIATVHDSITFEAPEALAYNLPDGTPAGKAVELVYEVCKRPFPYGNMATVDFPIDLEVQDFWDGKPDLRKALNGKTKEEEFRYDLIQDIREDDEEEEELVA